MGKDFICLPQFEPVVAQMAASCDFSMKVNSDCMSPYINRGDIIACSRLKDGKLRPGNVYVVDMGGIAYVNRVYEVPGSEDKIKLVSDNEKYPDYCVNKSDVAGIYGVVGMFRVVG